MFLASETERKTASIDDEVKIKRRVIDVRTGLVLRKTKHVYVMR